MQTINGKFFLYYVAFALFGYVLAAVIGEFIVMESESLRVTVQYRILAFAAAIIFIFRSFFVERKTHLDRSGRQGFSLLLIFWFIYTCRLFYDATFQENAIGEDTLIEYIITGYAFVFVTLMSLMRPYKQTDLEYIFEIGFRFLFTGVFLSIIIVAYAIVNDDWLGGSRFSLEHLNPISFGKYSAMLFIIAFGLKSLNQKKNLILNIGMTVGLLGVILSGSRGALVSILVVVLFIMLSKLISSRINLKKAFIFISFFSMVVWLVLSYMTDYVKDFDLISSYLTMGSEFDQSSINRYQMYEGALQQFYNSPILGDLIVQRDWKYYPHNHLLEILMATGIVGLSIFLLFNFIVFFKLRKILKKSETESTAANILSYLLIYFVISGLFSGSIISSGEYWLVTTLILFSIFRNEETGKIKRLNYSSS